MAKSAQASSSAPKRIPRIYVASPSDYNAGRLHGVWLEATDIQRVRSGVAAMLKASSPYVGWRGLLGTGVHFSSLTF
jgi:hypothetical protein